jgi:hypothetical protein
MLSRPKHSKIEVVPPKEEEEEEKGLFSAPVQISVPYLSR